MAKEVHSDTLQVQQALAAIGCYEGTIDDKSIFKLRRAVRCYQKSQNVPSTGELTDEEEANLLVLAKSGFVVEKVKTSQSDQLHKRDLPVPKPVNIEEEKYLKRAGEISKSHGPECGSFFRWQAPYLAEFSGSPDYRRQIQLMARNRRSAQPFVRLFEEEHFRKIAGFRSMSSARIQKWYRTVDECLRSVFGVNSALYHEHASLLSVLRHYNPEKRKTSRLSSLSIQPALQALEQARADAPSFLQEIQSADVDRISARELQKLGYRFNELERALWPSSVVEHGAALVRLADAVRRRAIQRKDEEKSRAIAQAGADRELCLSFVDPDEPSLPDGVAGSYELPSALEVETALAACQRQIAEDDDNLLLHLASGRLSLVMSRELAAERSFVKAASLGSAAALAYLGDLAEYPSVALKYYENAAKKGFEPAEEAALLMAEHIDELRALEEEELATARRLIQACDRLAAHPDDPERPTDIPGIEDHELKFEDAFEACSSAMEVAPDFIRTSFHLGRTLSLVDELQAEASVYLEAAHTLGYVPATYYLAGLKAPREKEALLNAAAAAGFGPAVSRLAELIRYPEQPDLSDIFANPSLVSAAASSGDLKAKSFSVDHCVNEIFVQVRDDKAFQNEMTAIIAVLSLAVCQMDSRYCGTWNDINESVRRDARQICLKEEQTFFEDYPRCLEPYWHEQNSAALDQAPAFATALVNAYHSIPGEFEDKAEGFDELAGEVTDLAAILYYEEVGLDFDAITVSDIDENHMLRDTADPETRKLLDDLKSSNKYEIAINMIPRDFVCDQ